jgi:hypothetical protein
MGHVNILKKRKVREERGFTADNNYRFKSETVVGTVIIKVGHTCQEKIILVKLS